MSPNLSQSIFVPFSYKISTSIAMGGTRAVMLYADEKVDLLIFFKPFTWPTWVTFFGLWFLYAVVLTAISLLSKRGADFSPTRPREDFTFWQSLSYFSVASLQLGPDKQPVSIGGKFLRQWWSFFCLIFVATYTANLAAIFSETSPSKPIKSIDNIIDSDFNISAFKTYESDFVEANNKILNELMRNNRIQFINMTEKGWSSAIKKALQSGHIWLDYDAHMEWFKKMNEDLTMYTLDGYFSVFSYGFAMRRNWTHLVQVRKLIRKFSGEGVIDQIKRKYQVSRDEKKGIRSLQFTSFVGVFCFVFSAAIVGLLVSLIDFLLQKRKIRRDELLIPRIRHTQF